MRCSAVHLLLLSALTVNIIHLAKGQLPPPATPALTPPPVPARLRVRNVGSRALENLSFYFPQGKVWLGTIAPHTTGAYRATTGVHTGINIRFTYKGKIRLSSMTDWVGETPRPGRAFTYDARLTVNRGHPYVLIVKVTRDE